MRRAQRREQDLDDEIQAHLRLAAEDRIAGGESPEQATASARREFGNATLIRETAREVWSRAWLESLFRDLRYAVRSFGRTPASTAIIILTLALGIGASAAIFSIVDAVLLRPLPYRDSARLVAVWDQAIDARETSKLFAPYQDFLDFEPTATSFQQIAGATWAGASAILTGHGPAKSVLAIPVTPGFFSLLGASAARGRTFGPSDAGHGCAVVLANAFWQKEFGGRKEIVGRALAIDDRSCTVAGVMPAGFQFYPEHTSLWTLVAPSDKFPRDRGMGIFARLKPGVTVADAQSEVRRLHRRFNEHNRHGEETEPAVYPLREEFTWLAGRNLRLTLVMLFAAVNFVLLIVCVNVANLLLGRIIGRQKELTIRAALGSGRPRLIRQLLTESLLLSAAAALLGCGLAAAAVRLFRAWRPVELPPGAAASLDLPVLGFILALAILTTLIVGVFPALRAASARAGEVLRAASPASSRGIPSQRASRVLVAAEVMLSLQLLTGAGLLIESVLRFTAAPLGFQPDGLTSLSIALPRATFSTDEQRVAFYRRVANTLGARDVTLSTTVPVRGISGYFALSVEGRPDPPAATAYHGVGGAGIDPAYFRVVGLAMHRGRNFEPLDKAGSDPVAIVNEDLAQRYFPGGDAIGRRIRISGDPPPNPWLRIVGVVANEKRSTVYNEMAWVDTPTVYRPLAQHTANGVNLLFRGAVPYQIRRQIESIDPAVPVGSPETMRDQLSGYLAYPRFRAALLAAFALLALLLALIGIYGVLSQQVARRTSEIGIRMALGAARSDIVRMVGRQGALLSITGIAIGLASVRALTRFLEALLYGVSPADPLTLGLVTLLLLATAALATILPAMRAMRVDPMVAVRYE